MQRLINIFTLLLAIALGGWERVPFSESQVALARVTPGKCTPAPKVGNVDCSDSGYSTNTSAKTKCVSCRQELADYIDNQYDRAQDAAKECKAKNCNLGSGGTTQNPSQATTRAAYIAAQQCLGEKAGLNVQVMRAADTCLNKLKDCEGLLGDDQKKIADNKTSCEKAFRDAKDTAADQKQKADDAGKNAEKSGDNKDKGESAGGMPPMPQIPPPQKGEDPQNAENPEPQKGSEITEKKAPELETSKLGGDSRITTNNVGFGGSSTATDKSTSPGSPDHNFGAYSSPYASSGDGRFKGAGEGSLANAGSGNGGSGGGLGGGGGALSSSASSAPSSAAATGDPANPYDVSGAGGGKLSAPKTKSGGESDANIDSAASGSFKNDLALDEGKNRDPADAGESAEDSDSGYTIFKMVSYRYSELKKKGSL